MLWPYQTFDDLESALLVLGAIVDLVHKESYDGEITIVDEIQGAILLSTRKAAKHGYVDQATADTSTLALLDKRHFIRRQVTNDGLSLLVQPTAEGFRAIELYRLITRHSKGIWSSRLRLYPDHFLDMVTPTPPIAEQERIVIHLGRETARIDGTIIKIRELVHCLHEYRTALITAAVTGKIDVRRNVMHGVDRGVASAEPGRKR
jgi:hypothetical protein